MTSLPYGLEPVPEDLPLEERCSIGVRNIQRLQDLNRQVRLLLGRELAFLKNGETWRNHPKARRCRTWEQFVCSMEWPSPFSNSATLTPKGAERLMDGLKEELLLQHLEEAGV